MLSDRERSQEHSIELRLEGGEVIVIGLGLWCGVKQDGDIFIVCIMPKTFYCAEQTI